MTFGYIVPASIHLVVLVLGSKFKCACMPVTVFAVFCLQFICLTVERLIVQLSATLWDYVLGFIGYLGHFF